MNLPQRWNKQYAATKQVASVADIDQGKESVAWPNFCFDTQTWPDLAETHIFYLDSILVPRLD